MSPETSVWLEHARTIADELDALGAKEQQLEDVLDDVFDNTAQDIPENDELTPIRQYDAARAAIELERRELTNELVGLLTANTNWIRNPESLIRVTRELLWGRHAARECHEFAALILKKVVDVDFPRPYEPFCAVHDMQEALSEIERSWYTDPISH